MPKITALIHVVNHQALALEHTLKSLRPCDEVLVIDHDSREESKKVAEQYGAAYKHAILGVDDGAYALDARNTWVLCLKPGESLSNKLEASLEDWKNTEPESTVGYLVEICEEGRGTGRERPRELRLVNRDCLNWKEAMPGEIPHAPALKGSLLRVQDRKHS